MTKLKIDIRNGLVEVEEDKDLAAQVYADFKDVLIARMQRAAEPGDETAEDDDGSKQTPQKPQRKKAKSSGAPSCASRIEELKNAGFFKSLQDNKSISDALAAKAQNYQSNQIAAPLTTLTKRGILRRVKQDNKYQYQNP
jgi:hypothetical protein